MDTWIPIQVTFMLSQTRSIIFGVGLPPEYLHKNSIEIMLCEVGHKTLRMFKSYGVLIFVGAKGTVREI